MVLGVLLAGALSAVAGNPFVSADKPRQRHPRKPSPEFRVISTNGVTTLLRAGRKVFSGRTAGDVVIWSMSLAGTDYAVACDDQKVIWEEPPGAAKQIGVEVGKSGPGSAERTITLRPAQARIATVTDNGRTEVFFNGREVFSGPTRGVVLARAELKDGQALAAAWEDGQVIWENVPGAARRLE